jgi:hypothetical protein
MREGLANAADGRKLARTAADVRAAADLLTIYLRWASIPRRELGLLVSPMSHSLGDAVTDGLETCPDLLSTQG